MEIVLLGCGLANSLIALRLHAAGVQNLRVIDKENDVVNDRTLSLFAADLPEDWRVLIGPAVEAQWSDHLIMFPNFSRHRKEGYLSLRMSKLRALVKKTLNDEAWIYREVKSVNGNGQIEFACGSRMEARIIFDGRGISQNLLGPCGYQKFVGVEIETSEPVSQTPIIMDATVEQIDGYRFIYTLPSGTNSVLVEDTRYSNSAHIDEESWLAELDIYIKEKISNSYRVVFQERGALAIPLTRQMFNHVSANRCLTVGVRGGFFHPITGYSFPQAIEVADLAAQHISDLDKLSHHFSIHLSQWQKSAYKFILLNQMLFGAASGPGRRIVFEYFYKRADDLVADFYSGKLSKSQWLRFFYGKPPVSVAKALKVLGSHSWMKTFEHTL